MYCFLARAHVHTSTTSILAMEQYIKWSCWMLCASSTTSSYSTTAVVVIVVVVVVVVGVGCYF
jgi:hypothetical protein